MTIHISVLRKEALAYLNVRSNHHYIDCTLGGGGHTEGILELNDPKGRVLSFELDEQTILRCTERLQRFGSRLTIHRGNFRDIASIVQKLNFMPVAGIMYDLGLSTDLLKASGRGFSFSIDEPLDMRFDTCQIQTAADLLHSLSEKELSDVIYNYGEERFSRRIAHSIVEQRKKKHIRTTFELVSAIESSVPAVYRHKKIHCATRTFQALRIAVNDELESLRHSLNDAFSILSPSGRIVVISFHSLEDRIVKRMFRDRMKEGIGRILTKKPVVPSDAEMQSNPASRSAKLRAIEMI